MSRYARKVCPRRNCMLGRRSVAVHCCASARSVCAWRRPQISTHALPAPPSLTVFCSCNSNHVTLNVSSCTRAKIVALSCLHAFARIAKPAALKLIPSCPLYLPFSSFLFTCLLLSPPPPHQPPSNTLHAFEHQRPQLFHLCLFAMSKPMGDCLTYSCPRRHTLCQSPMCTVSWWHTTGSAAVAPTHICSIRDGAPLRSSTRQTSRNQGVLLHLNVKLLKPSKRPSTQFLEGRLDGPVIDRFARIPPLLGCFQKLAPFY
jgi:hypothetical protein